MDFFIRVILSEEGLFILKNQTERVNAVERLTVTSAKRPEVKYDFGTMLKAGMLMRKLPQYAADKYITCHVIRNTQARFSNRKRPDGWLTPSARHLIQTHINLVHKMMKYLPVTDVALEVNRFAFMQLEDPSISGVDFQNGPLKGFDDLHAAVRDL